MTEQEKQELIQEITKQVTKTLKEELFLEYYALERNTFIERAYHLLSPMMIHWCLIRYGRLTDETQCIEHWKSELLTFMSDMAGLTMKGGNQTHKRLKAYKEAWSCADYDTDPHSVFFRCRRKFIDEGVNIESPVIMQVVTEFVEESTTLMELLANKRYDNIQTYIQSL